MKVVITIYTAEDLRSIVWGNAKATTDLLTDSELQDILYQLTENVGLITEIRLMEFFDYSNRDQLAYMLGYEDWEDLENDRDARVQRGYEDWEDLNSERGEDK